MQVSRLEDGLAVRLPDSVVEELGLKEGDEVGVYRVPSPAVDDDPEKRREEAMRFLDSLSRPFPPDYKFNREELHER